MSSHEYSDELIEPLTPQGYGSSRRTVRYLALALGLAVLTIIGLSVGVAVLHNRLDHEENPNTPTQQQSEVLKELASTIDTTRDTSVDPCSNFYEYACGSWLKSASIPGDRPSWTRSFDTIQQRNTEFLQEIGTAQWPLISPLYSSCMNLVYIEHVGATPLTPYFEQIDAVANTSSLFQVLGDVQRQTEVGFFFGLDIAGDAQDPSVYRLQVYQGGLVMGDQELYVGTQSSETLPKYIDHITEMLRMLDKKKSKTDLAAEAKAIVDFETAIAKFTLPPAAVRDPVKTYNPLNVDGLTKLAPGIDWTAYFTNMTLLDKSTKDLLLNVDVPAFHTALSHLISTTSLSTLKSYCKWVVLHSFAGHLSSNFERENFNFFGNFLNGQAEPTPRYKKCSTLTNSLLPDITGHYYAEAFFGGKSNDIAHDLIKDIKRAFEANLPHVDWMDDATRNAATEKLKLVFDQVGAPENWTDYSNILLDKNDYFGNVLRLSSFDFTQFKDRYNKPVDRHHWLMTMADVNAYYEPSLNSINFPAGILQPPFFNSSWPMTMNFGSIGLVMGHELTHGFDDQGSQYDGSGKLREWMPQIVRDKFSSQAKCLDDQYSNLTIPFKNSSIVMHINGSLTNGENIADNGGIHLAYIAFKNYEAQHGVQPVPPTSPAVTPDQLFFLSFAQGWCQLASDQYYQRHVSTDPHSPAFARVNEPLKNLESFGQAFNCPVNSPMNPQQKCKLW